MLRLAVTSGRSRRLRSRPRCRSICRTGSGSRSATSRSGRWRGGPAAPGGCEATVPLDPALLAALQARAGRQRHLHAGRRVTVRLPFSLLGFSAALRRATPAAAGRRRAIGGVESSRAEAKPPASPSDSHPAAVRDSPRCASARRRCGAPRRRAPAKSCAADLQPLDPAGAVLAGERGRLPDQEEPAGSEDAPHVRATARLPSGDRWCSDWPIQTTSTGSVHAARARGEVLLNQRDRAGEPRELGPRELERGAGDVDAGVAADLGAGERGDAGGRVAAGHVEEAEPAAAPRRGARCAAGRRPRDGTCS